MQISGLTTAGMPFDEFLVFAIEGMSLSGDMDIYNAGPDYVSFVKKQYTS